MSILRSLLVIFIRRCAVRGMDNLTNTTAIVAAAHKLARILYHLITASQAYQESVFA